MNILNLINIIQIVLIVTKKNGKGILSLVLKKKIYGKIWDVPSISSGYSE